jgi:hypothetical protein
MVGGAANNGDSRGIIKIQETRKHREVKTKHSPTKSLLLKCISSSK